MKVPPIPFETYSYSTDIRGIVSKKLGYSVEGNIWEM